MVNFQYLAILYAESRLEAIWHEDQCSCAEFPEACATYTDSEYSWRRHVPMSWTADAVTAYVLEFIALVGSDTNAQDYAAHEFSLLAADHAADEDGMTDELLIYSVYPL